MCVSYAEGAPARKKTKSSEKLQYSSCFSAQQSTAQVPEQHWKRSSSPKPKAFRRALFWRHPSLWWGSIWGCLTHETWQALALQDKKPSTNQKHYPQTRAVRVQMKPWRTRFRAVGFILSLQKDPRTKRVSLVTFWSSINLFLPSGRKVVPGTDRSSPANGGCGFIAPAQRHRHR